MYGGGGVNVEAPKESEEQRAYWAEMAADTKAAREKKEAGEKADATRKELLKSAGVRNLDPYYAVLKQQLTSGSLTKERALEQIGNFQQQYGMDPDNVASYLREIEQTSLEREPEQRTTLVQRAYKDLLGRAASESELSTRLGEISKSGGKLDLDAIATSLKSSDEYKEKVGGSYLENYYRSYYGPSEKETVKGLDGAPDWQKSTGKYTVKLGTEFSPQFDEDIQAKMGVRFGNVPASITGTAAEIEQAQQKSRARDEFAYNSGLLKLQGQIDSDIQKIRNKGTKDVAEISSKTNIYSGLTSGFFS